MKISDRKKYIITIAFAIWDLMLLYYLKHKINEVRLIHFSLSNIGNMFNLSLTIFFVMGLVILFFSRREVERKYSNLIFYLSLVMFITILLGVTVFIFQDSFLQDEISDFRTRKIIFAILFLCSEFFKLFIAVLVWTLIFSHKGFIYIKSFFFTLILVSFFILLSFLYVNFFDKDFKISGLEKYDVGVVLGAAVWNKIQPSPILEGRLNKAFGLYKSGLIEKIQLTGGNAPGEISEAEAAFNRLEALGVKENDMMLESNTSTTLEQIQFIRDKLILRRGYKHILIISDRFHLARIKEICKFFDVKAATLASTNKLDWVDLLSYKSRDSIGLLLFWFFAL